MVNYKEMNQQTNLGCWNSLVLQGDILAKFINCVLETNIRIENKKKQNNSPMNVGILIKISINA